MQQAAVPGSWGVPDHAVPVVDFPNLEFFVKKLLSAAAVALFAATPVLAASSFVVDFEQNWDYGTPVDQTYASAGVSFTNMLGLSNDADFTYYAGAPSMLGVAMAQLDFDLNTTAFMNVAGGVANQLSFFYASPSDVMGAVKAYSGLNGTGDLLGTFNLVANTTGGYDAWSSATFSFSGTARSFDLTGSANMVGFDNITAAVPEPETYAMLLAGLGVLGAMARRKKQQSAT